MRATRLASLDDAGVIAGLLSAGRDFFAPWEPSRADEYFTEEGQREVLRAALGARKAGYCLPHVILDSSGNVVGRVTLNEIVRGPAQFCSLGYWVAPEYNGKGLATAAVADIKRVAFEELGLHRIQAGTLVHNVRSQRVLEKNGFARFGIAPGYLYIAGAWQDHVLYQVLNPAH